MFSLRRLAGVIAVALLLLLVATPAAIAISPAELGSTRPDERVLDDADVFSRASRSELESRLEGLTEDRVDARIITVRRLDYGFSLDSFGEQLIENWSGSGQEPLLLLLLETQNKRAAIVTEDGLQSQLPPSPVSYTHLTLPTTPYV